MALKGCAAKDKGNLCNGAEVVKLTADVDKAATTDALWEVDGKIGVFDTLGLEITLDHEGPTSHIFLFVGAEASLELPSNGAGSDPGSVRTREGEIFPRDQRWGSWSRGGVGTLAGSTASSPNVKASDHGGERVRIRFIGNGQGFGAARGIGLDITVGDLVGRHEGKAGWWRGVWADGWEV